MSNVLRLSITVYHAKTQQFLHEQTFFVLELMNGSTGTHEWDEEKQQEENEKANKMLSIDER